MFPVKKMTGSNAAILMPNEASTAAQAPFTQAQGQYLAFIYAYTTLNRRAPAEADFRDFFEVTAPSVHQMILALERNGFIRRTPGVPRSIALLLAPESLPLLR
jgi:DNA-binding MarR family transcriptional regulator